MFAPLWLVDRENGTFSERTFYLESMERLVRKSPSHFLARYAKLSYVANLFSSCVLGGVAAAAVYSSRQGGLGWTGSYPFEGF